LGKVKVPKERGKVKEKGQRKAGKRQRQSQRKDSQGEGVWKTIEYISNGHCEMIIK
jgi:hypothetical protein